MELTAHHIDAGCFIGGHNNLLVGVWWQQAIAEQAPVVLRCHQETHRRFPGGHCFATIILPGASLLGLKEDVRRTFAEITTTTDAYCLGNVFVETTGGFHGSALRAFLTGIFLLAGKKQLHKVVGNLESAADWLGERLELARHEAQWTPELLEDALRQAAAQAPLAKRPNLGERSRHDRTG